MDDRCWSLAMDTSNTTRIDGPSQYDRAVAVSQTVWANPMDPMMRPGVAILARGDGENYQDALAGAPLIHFPRNGPVLLTEPDRLLPVVAGEILRLSPSGKGSPAQVLVLGPISENVKRDVERLGFTALQIDGGNPVDTAATIADLLDRRRNIMVVSAEDFQEALPAGGWAAHMGDPILYSYSDELPSSTARVIMDEQPDVYLVGSPQALSPAVENTIRRLTAGFVDRISGADPFEVAINFTRYSSPTGQFGWNVNERQGWGLRFARVDMWQDGVNGNPLSHMGKHAPLLLVATHEVPPAVADYMSSINPLHMEPKPPFMHGFLVGRTCDMDCPVQWHLDRLLDTVQEMGM